MRRQNTIPAKEGGAMPHGNDGNQHAKKAVTRSTYIQVRCTPEEKSKRVQLAEKSGLTLSEFMLQRTSK